MIKKILVVDDERSNALLLARRLEGESFEVATAYNGKEALKYILNHQVDLLITDVVMPEMDGVDLYLEIKNDPVRCSMPVIFVTDKEIFQESLAALNVEFYAAKPYSFSHLLSKIKMLSEKVDEHHEFRKVVVISHSTNVLEDMREKLVTNSCIVAKVDSVVEIGLRCFLTNPHLIVLDLQMHDQATTKEIIRSLRSYAFFYQTAIVIFSHFTSQDLLDQGGTASIEAEVQACLDAGATKYIGRFNKATFIEQLGDLLSNPKHK